MIAEKTGPHFAVGDTCYSWAEDKKVYNPNGKEIIARIMRFHFFGVKMSQRHILAVIQILPFHILNLEIFWL